MKRKNVVAAVAGVAGTVALVAGCQVPGSSPQLNDLRNAQQVYPDYAATIMNVDNFPNITVVCFHGAGFATTTRPDMSAMVPDHDLAAFCQSQEGKQTK